MQEPVDPDGKVCADDYWKYRWEHTTCVVDLESRLVHQVPGDCYAHIAWIG